MSKTIKKLIAQNHRLLDKAVHSRLPKSELTLYAVPAQALKRGQCLADCEEAYHRSWKSLDSGRRSAACRYEWARLQMFLAGKVHPVLAALDRDLFHVILADKRWRVRPSCVGRGSFNAPRRKVRSSIKRLRDGGHRPVFVAVYEMSGDRNINGDYVFEPHVHILIGRVSSAAVKAAFQVRLPRATRGRDKPLRVEAVPINQVGNLLGYLSKMKPQDRVEYIGSNGRPNRATNRMRRAEADQWLRCMATMPITWMIQFGGFANAMHSHFSHLEMATIIGELA